MDTPRTRSELVGDGTGSTGLFKGSPPLTAQKLRDFVASVLLASETGACSSRYAIRFSGGSLANYIAVVASNGSHVPWIELDLAAPDTWSYTGGLDESLNFTITLVGDNWTLTAINLDADTQNVWTASRATYPCPPPLAASWTRTQNETGDALLSINNNVEGVQGATGFSGYSGVSGYSGFSGYSGVGSSGYSGAIGGAGSTGTSGYSGISGWSGYSGVSGYSGKSGYSGISGFSGYSGISGFSGYSGYSGISGSNGTNGTNGNSGYSGISGWSGYSGISGFSGYSGISGFSGYSGKSGYSGTTAIPLVPAVIALSDGATPALNAALGNTFTLTAAGDRTIAIPSNPVNGQRIVILHHANGGARTLSLNAGGFLFGADITGLTQTASGKVDAIGAIYSSLNALNKWLVVAYVKGFA